MKHGSLFNGIGGFQLAAKWMEWENVFSCEIDEWCNKITKKHFPNCIQHGDIKTTDFTIYRGRIDIISGGFPCQPYSQAGKRLGKDDDRHLWPEMLRAIREIQPCYVVGENVRGITNWNGGLVFDEVQADLEAEGYEILPFLLPACAVNAPHRRDRIWFIAYNSKYRKFNDGGIIPNSESEELYDRQEINQRQKHEQEGTGLRDNISSICKEGIATNPEYKRCKEQWAQGTFRSPPTVPSIRGRVEPGFRGGDDGFSSRVDRIKGLGNAVVPVLVYEIFKVIKSIDNG